MTDQNTKPTTPPLPDPVVIIQTDATTYDVSIAIDRLDCLTPENNAVMVWLLKRDPTDTVNLYIHASSQPESYVFVAVLPLANAINMCKAKTVAYVDHIYSDMSSYVLLAADEMVFSPFAMVQYPPLSTDTMSGKATSAFAFYLVDRAVTRGYLSPEDANYIKSGRMVIKTPGKG